MKRKQRYFDLLVLLILMCITYAGCVKDVGRLPASAGSNVCDSLDVKYSTTIQAMVQNNCAISGCHDGGPFSSYPNDLTDFATLKTVADNGRVKLRVITLKTMPPTGPLPDSLIQRLNCWLEAGAPNN